MRPLAEEALEALEDGTALVSAAFWIDMPEPLRIWGGEGELDLDGETFLGVASNGLVEVGGQSVGGQEQGAVLTLSGVDPEQFSLVDLDAARGAPCVIYRLIFNATGSTLLDGSAWMRGRIDRLPLEEVPGGQSVLRAHVESAARGLGRRRGRMRTHADQQLVSATDRSFSRVAWAAQKTLNWGGKPSAAAGAVLAGGNSFITRLAWSVRR